MKGKRRVGERERARERGDGKERIVEKSYRRCKIFLQVAFTANV